MSSLGDRAAAAELRRGWPLVLTCAVGMGLGLSGLPFFTQGVFADPLRAAFGWSQAQVQGGLTASYATTVVMMPVIGWLCDRFGSRPVALWSMGLFGLSYMLLGLADGNYLGFLATWCLMSATGTGTLTLTWGRALSAKFDRARGMAMGLALVGEGATGFFGPPLAGWLIAHFGWRLAFVGLAALPLVLALPMIFLFLRDGPSAQTARRVKGEPFAGGALRNWRLWLMGVCFMMIATGVTALVPNLMKLMTSHGLAPDQALGVLSIMGLATVIGRFIGGWLMDKLWAPLVALAFLLMPAAACFLLADPGISVGAASIAAALIGLMLGGEFDLMPYLVSRYFGLPRFGQVLGVIASLFYFGAAIGAPLMGWVYDVRGDFAFGLVGAGALFLGAAAGFLLLGRYPKEFAMREAEG